MILGLLTQKPFVLSFIEHLNALGGVTILLNLIRRSVLDAVLGTDYLEWPVHFLLFNVDFLDNEVTSFRS